MEWSLSHSPFYFTLYWSHAPPLTTLPVKPFRGTPPCGSVFFHVLSSLTHGSLRQVVPFHLAPAPRNGVSCSSRLAAHQPVNDFVWGCFPKLGHSFLCAFSWFLKKPCSFHFRVFFLFFFFPLWTLQQKSLGFAPPLPVHWVSQWFCATHVYARSPRRAYFFVPPPQLHRHSLFSESFRALFHRWSPLRFRYQTHTSLSTPF